MCVILEYIRGLHPSEIWEFIGGDVKFTCLASSNAQWSFNGGDLPPNCHPTIDGLYAVLEISGVQLYNSGYYECYGDVRNSFFISRSELAVYGTFELNIIFVILSYNYAL